VPAIVRMAEALATAQAEAAPTASEAATSRAAEAATATPSEEAPGHTRVRALVPAAAEVHPVCDLEAVVAVGDAGRRRSWLEAKS
jgi:hypothetical protein